MPTATDPHCANSTTMHCTVGWFEKTKKEKKKEEHKKII
jgi:hypothetical protein